MTALAERLGRALGLLLEPVIGARVRAHCAAKFGTCRVCAAPLGGASPDRVCVGCHASELLAGFGGDVSSTVN